MLSRKKSRITRPHQGQPLEKWTEIFKSNFRKLSVLFEFEPKFPEILVEWNAPNFNAIWGLENLKMLGSGIRAKFLWAPDSTAEKGSGLLSVKWSGFGLHSRNFRSAYHLNGIFGNSEANSNGTENFCTICPLLQCQALHGNTSAKECLRSERWRQISKTFIVAMWVFARR